MINRHITYLLSLISVLLMSISCNKKEIPEIPQENSPVFNVVGTIDGKKIKLHAGENNAFMLPKIEKLNSVDQFTGQLTDGNSSVYIRFFDSNIDIPSLSGNFIEHSNYEIGEQYGFGLPPLLTITPENFTNSELIENIEWEVEGILQNSSALTFYEPGKYNVCAKLNFHTGESASSCNSIIVGYHSNGDVQLNFDLVQNEKIYANINIQEDEISSIEWFIDNEFRSDDIYFSTTDIPNKFTLKAKVQLTNGKVDEREVFINKQAIDYSLEDFAVLGEKPSLKWDSKVILTVELNGITYQSINNPASGSNFTVHDISEYKTNSDGSKVKLLKGTLDTPFLNTTTGGIVNGAFEIEIGVAH